MKQEFICSFTEQKRLGHEKYELMCLQYIPLKLGTDACVATECR